MFKFKSFILLISGIVFAENNDAFLNAGRRAATPQSSLESAQSFIDFGVSFMLTLLLVSGLAMLMAALVQYLEHRKNPMNPPLSKVVTLLVIGIVLVGSSFLPGPEILP